MVIIGMEERGERGPPSYQFPWVDWKLENLFLVGTEYGDCMSLDLRFPAIFVLLE
jgi:hypothetical protein